MITIIDTGKVGSAAGFYIQLKSATTYAPGAVIAMMADAVLKGRNRVMSVSTCPEGVYSCSAVSIGVRVVLGKNGLERIIELKLSTDSQMFFDKSAKSKASHYKIEIDFSPKVSIS